MDMRHTDEIRKDNRKLRKQLEGLEGQNTDVDYTLGNIIEDEEAAARLFSDSRERSRRLRRDIEIIASQAFGQMERTARCAREIQACEQEIGKIYTETHNSTHAMKQSRRLVQQRSEYYIMYKGLRNAVAASFLNPDSHLVREEMLRKTAERYSLYFTDEWLDYKFKDLGTVKSGVGFSTKYQGHLDLEYNLYKVSDMNLKGNERVMVKSNNTIDDSILKEMNAKLITEPSIIFAKVGEAIFLNRKRIANKPFLIDNNMMAFTPNNKVNTDFMYYLSTTINFGKYAQTGALPSYNASDINTIKCKIPSKEEQEKITAILSLADAKIDFYSNQLDKTKEFKKGLLQQMFV